MLVVVLVGQNHAVADDQQAESDEEELLAHIAKLQKHIMSLRSGASIVTENKISIVRHYDDTFQIIMPKTKSHIPIYTDKDVVKLLVNNRDGFEMISGNMKASINENKMPKLLELLGERFSLSVKIPRHYFDEFLDRGSKHIDTKEAMKMFETDKKEFPQRLAKQKASFQKSKPDNEDKTKSLKLVKLRAKAILIMQKQMRNVAGIGSHPKIKTIL